MNTVRLNITLPKDLAEELRVVASSNISKYIADSLEEKIKLEKKIKALEELDKLPAGFPRIKDSVGHVKKLRLESDTRNK